ncbi:hypothetical protein, partial [Pseudomonas aeruginosa]
MSLSRPLRLFLLLLPRLGGLLLSMDWAGRQARQQQQEQAQWTGQGHRRIETAAGSGDDSTAPGYTARRTRSPPMSLSPWSHSCSAGFTLRGWRSEPSGKPW